LGAVIVLVAKADVNSTELVRKSLEHEYFAGAGLLRPMLFDYTIDPLIDYSRANEADSG